MSKGITVKQLYKLCEIEMRKGNGDCVVMISQDDECNSYHYLWEGFTTVEEHEKPFEYMGKTYQFDFEYCDERIAPKEKTITLN